MRARAGLGEIEVLDHKKGNIVVKRLRPQDQEYVANGIVFFKETANGVIGMSAIVGRRRATTMVASQISEVLLITKEALAQLFNDEPDSARRLCKILLRGLIVQDRIERLKKKVGIGIRFKKKK